MTLASCSDVFYLRYLAYLIASNGEIFFFLHTRITTLLMSKRSITDEEEDSSKRRLTGIIPHSSNPIKNGVSQCFYKFSTNLYVSLAPCYVQDPVKGIRKQHLDSLIMSYFPEAKGIVLSYNNIKLSPENLQDSYTVAKISGESPFAFLWCSVDFLIWRPQVGDVVEGWAYLQTQSHIGLLVHDTFNATLRNSNIPSTWRFIPNEADEVDEDYEEDGAGENGAESFRSLGYWVDQDNNPVDGKIKFTVKSIHTAGRVVSLEGTLLKPETEKDSLPVTKSSHKKFDERETVEFQEPSSQSPTTTTVEINLDGYQENENEEDKQAKEEDNAEGMNGDDEVPKYETESSDSE
ncbi:BA75_03837T0 [Komagataella pastoris]|uniref:DNA-directed RNA polymerase subunit n=1 Tax=Komagataella pastoris TaxID=4922 RepID=A0A1B2JFQ1_PICPA|nr:BA75_03837T0 [Komagataella pastoris]